ncbi:MAG: transcription termination factor NusA [Victivallaceae bacterium]|nr:transcription termination factor NusA [Victivallaceae bacterium]MDD3117509.1 transcription termination factor NusA [Victivallaceae bacterium]MDD3704413.1 transcription termination factor NusA [Victivallaceae bacterium]MDD4318169.1 transcription termination factor NusA [Victivallaceae bacterium]NLK83632.1 transcription termination factor NusA [Lentisphaerota bacterium]
MANELLTILEYIEQERGINREVMTRALETALLTAAKKSIHPASDLKIKIDPKSGDIRVWAILEVVEANPNDDQLLLSEAAVKMPDVKVGDVVEWELPPKDFGRIAAQTARQTIMQQLRRAEKDTVREEFADKIGTVINGIVRRFENGSIIIDFQKAEGILSPRDKIHGESYMPGDRINVLLLKVDTMTSGPSLIVSRTHSDFVKQMFVREVSEIKDGVVEIMGIAREPGSRSKIAVKSNDPRVDPVGACVGMRGIRVKNITNELSGERVDIIPYDEDIRQYAINSLQPAKVISVEADSSRRDLKVKVSQEQSKLAFGKKAQNVRLSSKLLGWNMNIIVDEPTHEKSIEEKLQEAITNLAESLKISNETAGKLVKNGFLTVDGIEAGREQIINMEEISEEEAKQIFGSLEG